MLDTKSNAEQLGGRTEIILKEWPSFSVMEYLYNVFSIKFSLCLKELLQETDTFTFSHFCVIVMYFLDHMLAPATIKLKVPQI